MTTRRNVAILLFDDVEVLDFAGPFEVFAVTSEINSYEPFQVYTVAAEKRAVVARNGLKVMPDYDFEDCPEPDLLVVPGGVGTRKAMKDLATLEWVRRHAAAKELTLSVCTGALVLGAAGLLDGLRATTHHENLEMLQDLVPSADVTATERFVDNGRLITAGGISAGIDMSLHVVKRLLGEDAARRTAVYMEYGDWRA